MSALEKLRDLLLRNKVQAIDQGQQKFLPEGSLDQIFREIDLTDILCSTSFQVKSHKLDYVAHVVSTEGRKLLAILADLKLEHALLRFVEYGILDRILPIVEKKRLESILDPHERDEFMRRQWEFLAHTFSKRIYSQRLGPEHILPFVGQTKIGGGSFSTVYEVLIHPRHQDIDPGVEGRVNLPLHIINAADFSARDCVWFGRRSGMSTQASHQKTNQKSCSYWVA